MAPGSASERVNVGGHVLTLTNLDKVMYPETGTTKADVIGYYSQIADVLIPHAADRPVTRKRWVHGVGTAQHPGQVFFQKNLDSSAPSWVARRAIEHSDHRNEYPLLNNAATLVWLAQIASLEIHVPQWRFGPRGARRNPDRLVLDLDPGEGVGLPECAEVARMARAILQGMGLDPYPVTSGSKGIHLYAALAGKQNSDQVSAVAHELARSLAADHPDLVVSDMKKSLRRGKVLVDWSQNNAAKTTITPYSLRGRAHPMVAAPRTWRELAAPDLAHLDYQEVLRRVARRGDLLKDLDAPPDNPAATASDSPEDAGERLAVYRSKRNAAVTPEPMGGDAGSGDAFVIQEHHASRLHWDFRLEHDGVLVSWALPKGVPTDTKRNHLAVQTEDHPLDYGGFEGVIPKGEYGAGTVTIWDSGRYDLEKWRDGEEVIATLHGEPGGGLGQARRFALIRTGERGKDDERNWLIHLMKPAKVSAASRSAAPAPATNRAPVKDPAPRAQPVAPMLATLGSMESLGGDDDWAFEMKWDGIRAIATKGDTIHLHTRNGIDVTATYPEVARELMTRVTVPSAVLDGELVALDGAGRPSFSRLQQRMGLTKPSDVERAMAGVPVQYLVFDLLRRDGTDLTRTPYDERRDALAGAIDEGGAIQVPPAFSGDALAALATSRELGLEGIVAKTRDGRYTPGRRSGTWVKIKHHKTQEVVVVGWLPGKGRRAGTVGSLLLGLPDEHGLRFVGKVGTGFSDADLERMGAKFARMTRSTPPVGDVPRPDATLATWLTPRLVGEVEFAEWTDSGRLRQPSWRGWRPDKVASEIRRES